MTFDYAHLLPIVPEIAVLVLASILLLVDLWLKDEDKGTTTSSRSSAYWWSLASRVSSGAGNGRSCSAVPTSGIP